jgi:hypothetical protein
MRRAVLVKNDGCNDRKSNADPTSSASAMIGDKS